MNDTTPDAYWLEVGGRAPSENECGNGASLGPFVTREVAEATGNAIRGWTLGQIEERGIGAMDTYGRNPDGTRRLAASKDEVVRWAIVREQWVDERDIDGLATAWDPGNAEPVYDDFIPTTTTSA